MSALIVRGDARQLPLAAGSVDAIVTDPPYELGFMGRSWDASGVAYDVDMWRECLRVLRPGGHLLAFGGTRTSHRMVCAVEDAGFEIRDSITWLYASGFPKSLDVSKAIDKAAGVERKVVGSKLDQPGYSLTDGNGDHRTYGRGFGNTGNGDAECAITAPATPAAERWQGWGTALKPASEPIVVARKPLAGTVAANVLTHGTGALNIDACRVPHDSSVNPDAKQRQQARHDGADNWRMKVGHEQPMYAPGGRWPSNVVLTHHPECAEECHPWCHVAEMDRQSGDRPTGALKPYVQRDWGYHGGMGGTVRDVHKDADSGGASRFFPVFRYEAKAPTSERPRVDGVSHPTVKPLDLMRWLVRLVTPTGGVVLDPFAGSGTTVEACLREGFRCVAVEEFPPYLPLIQERVRRTARPWEPAAPSERTTPVPVIATDTQLGLFDGAAS